MLICLQNFLVWVSVCLFVSNKQSVRPDFVKPHMTPEKVYDGQNPQTRSLNPRDRFLLFDNLRRANAADRAYQSKVKNEDGAAPKIQDHS